MPNRFIYAFQAGSPDPSRWLSVTQRENGDCVLHLQDLCMPGRVSQLSTVTCPLGFLRTALGGGALQVSAATGYLLLRRVGDLLNLEFRGLDDITITKAAVKVDELQARVEELRGNSLALTS